MGISTTPLVTSRRLANSRISAGDMDSGCVGAVKIVAVPVCHR